MVANPKELSALGTVPDELAGSAELRDLGWSSRLCEQMHISEALAKKFHPNIGQGQRRARDMARCMLPRVAGESEDRNRIALQRKHERTPLKSWQRIPVTRVSSQTISVSRSNVCAAVETMLRLLNRKSLLLMMDKAIDTSSR